MASQGGASSESAATKDLNQVKIQVTVCVPLWRNLSL